MVIRAVPLLSVTALAVLVASVNVTARESVGAVDRRRPTG